MSDLNNDVRSMDKYKSAADKLTDAYRLLTQALPEMRDFYRDNLQNPNPIAVSLRDTAWGAMRVIALAKGNLHKAFSSMCSPSTPSTPAIAPGDLVKLATGKSPLMVVETTGNGGATCVWFDTTMTAHRETFSDTILTKEH